MKNSIEISTRKSSDGKYVFVDRMLISIGDLTFGDGEAVSVSGLMLGAIDDLLSNIEKQKNNVDFAKRVFDQTLPPAHFFQLLHDAWVDGEWSKNLGHSLLAPDAYIGLPSGTEIFDSSEAYFVFVDFEKAFLFANDEAKNEVVALKIDVIEYVKIWEQARAEIVFGKNGVA